MVLYFTYPLNAVVMMALPVGLWLVLAQRWRLGWTPVVVGALMFVGAELVRMPLLYGLTALFQSRALPSVPQGWAPAFNIAVLCLTAGFFEETARYVGYRWLLPKARSWREAVAYGAGHGGIEALLLGGLVLVTFANMLALRGMDVSTLPIPAGQQAATAQQVAAYWVQSWPLTLLGAVERALTIPIHLSLSVLVLQTFTRRNIVWLLAAMGWHALVNAVTVSVLPVVGPAATEGVLAVLTLVSVGIMFALRPRGDEPGPAAAEAAGLVASRTGPAQKLDDSRYTR